MRDIIAVIDQVIEAVPDDFELKPSLVAELEGRKTSCKYTAPELMGTRWVEASLIIEDYCRKELDTGALWAFTVLKIWADNPNL
jgi:hypothetical protein